MREYELVFIVDPTQDEEGVAAVTDRVTKAITSTGEVTRVDVWGRRKLAYPIKRFREGTYVLMRALLTPEGIAELDRTLKLTEPVIRHLLVRADET
ncbi:MAG: 30S ribosomal protein S6 [Anaerolineae bacterium]|nr:30S ribosomal protein S6 [Anaerolineae bacterium]